MRGTFCSGGDPLFGAAWTSGALAGSRLCLAFLTRSSLKRGNSLWYAEPRFASRPRLELRRRMAGIDFQALPAADDVGQEMHDLIARALPDLPQHHRQRASANARADRRANAARDHRGPDRDRGARLDRPAGVEHRRGLDRGPDGERVVDFADSNLHVLGYSVPVRKRLPLAELKEHLFTLPEHPDWIPFRNSYYTPNWGFCLQHSRLESLPEGEYEVCIDSTLEDGSLTYAEALVPGETDDEVLVSGYACHPSMANDNLSGLVLMTALAKHLAGRPLRYSYRFLFSPGTIGPIAWLARNEERLERVKHGLVCLCVGDPGALTYKKSRRGDARDRPGRSARPARLGRRLRGARVGALGRRRAAVQLAGLQPARRDAHPLGPGQLPEYHTSADDLDFVRPGRWAEASTPTCPSSTCSRRTRPT